MTDAPEHRNSKGVLKYYLWALGIAFSLIIAKVALNWLFGAVRSTDAGLRQQVSAAVAGGRKAEYGRELRTYVLGFSLALVLTLVPFGLVNWSAMSQYALALAIGAFALVQVVIHFRCFLHINPPKQNLDDLHLILFSTLLLFFMAGGTIWILANLAMRMQ